MMITTSIPPYYAVIFTSVLREDNNHEYEVAALELERLVKMESGYLGHESYRNNDGYGVTISYWKSLEDISSWKRNLQHKIYQKEGKLKWYEKYIIRIAKIERDYTFEFEK